MCMQRLDGLFKRITNNIYRSLFKAAGRNYLLNKKTGETHDLDNEHVNCHIGLISNFKMIKEITFRRMYVDKTTNGCRWCLKEWDNDENIGY